MAQNKSNKVDSPKNGTDQSDDNKPKEKRVGWVRLRPGRIMWKDSKSGISLSKDNPVAAVTNNMDKTVINSAILNGDLAIVNSEKAKWPKDTKDSRRIPLVEKHDTLNGSAKIRQLNPSALNEFGFTKELYKNPNWQILNNPVIKHIRKYVSTINDPDIIAKMIKWEGDGMTNHAHPRVAVINMLSERQRELGRVDLVRGTHVAETEKESITFA